MGLRGGGRGEWRRGALSAEVAAQSWDELAQVMPKVMVNTRPSDKGPIINRSCK